MEPEIQNLPVFRVNQIGYAAGMPVHAAVLACETAGVIDQDGNRIAEIKPDGPREDEASGDRVAKLSVGPLPEGRYFLENGRERREIRVCRKPWQQVLDALVKGLYYQRCGCELKEIHAGRYAHPACHTAQARDWEEPSRSRRITGGWHDAGDYGKYVGPGAVAASHMLYAYMLCPDSFRDPLNIPETGNGRPDVLSEVQVELEWLLQMQRSDGAFYHKLTKARFAPFILPQDDHETEYLMPVSHCATAAACACLALASRVYATYDIAFSKRMLLAAQSAWDWLQEHPDFVPFTNPEGVQTGEYGDGSDRDERFWAACELYAATGGKAYRTQAEELFALGQNLTSFGWEDTGGFGALCCLFDLGEKAGDILYSALKEAFLRQSREVLSLAGRSGYGTALEADGYVWGSILPILSNAAALLLSHRLTGEEEMLLAGMDQWHYALGMNALDKCFVTGFGDRPVRFPHHRPSAADDVEEPVPGFISGGPNQCFPYDSTRERLGDTPPAKYYLDETPSADTNEIAVYWNSIAILVAAYLNDI